MTEIGQQILSQGNQEYQYTLDKDELYFGAVEFPEEESYILGGPFNFSDKFYGLISVMTEKNLLPLETVVKKMYIECTSKESEEYMPKESKERLKKYFSPCILYIDPETQQCFSSVDINYGKNEINVDVFNRLETKGESDIFFKTEGGKKEILSWLIDEEITEWENNLKSNAIQSCQLVEKISCCIEKPYKVFLYGTDDTSYTTTMKNMKEVEDFIKNISSVNFILNNMVSTN